VRIEILGAGCDKCETLAANAKTAAEQLGVDAEVVKISDLGTLADRGVMLTPALAVDGQIKLAGRSASVQEIVAWLSR
jgi:small redox-active disulfide protein 2